SGAVQAARSRVTSAPAGAAPATPARAPAARAAAAPALAPRLRLTLRATASITDESLVEEHADVAAVVGHREIGLAVVVEVSGGAGEETPWNKCRAAAHAVRCRRRSASPARRPRS